MLCLPRILAVCVFLSCCAVVFGQQPFDSPTVRGPRGGGPPLDHAPPGPLPLALLAMQKSVQTELKLDQTQKQRIHALAAKLRESMPKRGPEPPDRSDVNTRREPPDTFPPTSRPGLPGGDEMQKQMEQQLAEILSEKQLARLKQIALQLEGPVRLLAPERAKELELTEEQMEKIRRLTRKDEKSISHDLECGAKGQMARDDRPTFPR